MTFSDLKINKSLLRALDDIGITEPSPIQEKVFSVVKSGKDICAIAQTGTGKTFAYLLPILSLYSYSKTNNPTIFILVPTRELVVQVEDEIKKITAYMSVRSFGIYGGTNTKPQADKIFEGLDILVGTPGRMVDFVNTGVLNLKNVKHLIIDEFDEMLNLGFRAQLKVIFDKLPERRQNLLFSATLIPEVIELMDEYFNNPEKIEAVPAGTPLDNISQTMYRLPNFYSKVKWLVNLLRNEAMTKILIFVSTKKKAEVLYDALLERGIRDIDFIHSNKNQNARFETVQGFEEGRSRILIATDLLSRGLDIREVTHVFNFDLPEVVENYIHRIGRTGRYEKEGTSIAFVVESEEEQLEKIQELMNYTIPEVELPEDFVADEKLLPEEEVKITMPFITQAPKLHPERPAFHQKSILNSKVNVRYNHEAEMKKKYGKQYEKKKPS
ncbi:MAG: DEAD/DEAH box helicase [Saprospiraceae bacterium]|nr:DEAD/DEAH box helicase [Candidatus Brachybacter algidus]